MANTDHRSTQRVIDVMELLAFSENAAGFTLTGISQALHCPKSSISPILHTLLHNGYLACDSATARYSVGRRAFEVGSTFVNDGNFYPQVLAVMRDVVNACSEACHIAELNGSNVLYLLKVDSPQTIRMFSAPGRKLPANATALGKALLSQHSREELCALFPDGLPRVTANTITDMDLLCRQLQEVRRTGYAFEREENAEFIQCIAVPICKNRIPTLAISVTVPTFRYTEEKGALIRQLLTDARAAIEKVL